MAVNVLVKRASAAIVLDIGSNKTARVSMSGLRGNADAEKIYNIVDLAAPCLAEDVARVEYTEVRTLEKM